MLHGNIRVNDYGIGQWTAVRKERVYDETTDSPTYRYECSVTWHDLGGYPHVSEFDMFHSYHDGALVLASKILARAEGLDTLPTT